MKTGPRGQELLRAVIEWFAVGQSHLSPFALSVESAHTIRSLAFCAKKEMAAECSRMERAYLDKFEWMIELQDPRDLEAATMETREEVIHALRDRLHKARVNAEEERERCAALVEKLGEEWSGYGAMPVFTPRTIAQLIRSQS